MTSNTDFDEEQTAPEMIGNCRSGYVVVKNCRTAELEGTKFTIYVDTFDDNTAHITTDENTYGFMFSDDAETKFANKAEAATFKQRFEDTNNSVSLSWVDNTKASLLLTLDGKDENNEQFVYTYELHDNVYPSHRDDTDVCLSGVLHDLKTDNLEEMKNLYITLVNEFNSFRGAYIGRD